MNEEHWINENKYLAAILMDISKAFDCLLHDLLLLNLKTYGLSKNAINHFNRYLTNRKQCIRIESFKSNFKEMIKGVPQGSILCPVSSNIFKIIFSIS